MPEISVVIIFYRVEQYIRACVDSILAQTCRDFELILVDDGSPDGCPAICDAYREADPRVRVLHQSNQGSVAARWNGICAAKGDYVIALDGDDFAEPEMLARMLALAKGEDADIVVVGYQEDAAGVCTPRGNRVPSGVYRGEVLEELKRRALYDGVFYEPGITASLNNKLIRRELLFTDYSPADFIVRMGDDASVTYPMLARAACVAVDNENRAYHYRIRGGSLSRTVDSRFLERGAALLRSLEENLQGCQKMAAGLSYYALFIGRIGLDQIFARENTLPFSARIGFLRGYGAELRRLTEKLPVCWEGIPLRQRRLLQPLASGRLLQAVARQFWERLLVRLPGKGAR